MEASHLPDGSALRSVCENSQSDRTRKRRGGSSKRQAGTEANMEVFVRVSPGRHSMIGVASYAATKLPLHGAAPRCRAGQPG